MQQAESSDQVRFCNLLHTALQWIQWYPGKLMIAGGAAVWMKQHKLTPALVWRIASGVDRPIDCSWLPGDVDVWCNGVIEVPGLRRPEGDTTICHPLKYEARMPAYADMPVVEGGFYDRLAHCHDIDTEFGKIQFLRMPTGWDSEPPWLRLTCQCAAWATPMATIAAMGRSTDWERSTVTPST